MKPAVFLDRDGVITSYGDHIYKIEDFHFIDGSSEAIRMINESGLLAVVITNQAGIARGLFTEKQMNKFNEYMLDSLAAEGAHIDSIYFCPHHPTIGDNPELTKSCFCRKPKPGMIFQAKTDFDIYLGSSWLVGDSYSDIGAGRSAGCKTILVESGIKERGEIQPDFKAKNLYEAVTEVILKR
jgi:D,D-heptose 1,7-bisphosphate phosphatase